MTDSSSTWTDQFQFAAVSDVGMRRLNNQDAYVLLPAEDESTWRTRGHMLVVADGMGAHAAGELASKLAVEGVAHHYRKLRQLSPPEAILRALRETNSEIHQRGQANSEFHNMGTTCSALLLLPQGALVAHVGDSRVYRVRGKRLEQLTFDHSLFWEMRTAGSLGGAEVTYNIPKNVITRSLGPHAVVQVDLEGPLEVEPGDVFLLCSDGLTGKVEDDEIRDAVAHLPPHAAAQLLVDLANIRGGPDNITVLIVRATDLAAATRHWRGEPLVVGQELRPPPRVHTITWIGVVLGFVLAAGLAILQLYPAAAISLLAACVAVGVAWWQLHGAPADGVALTGGRRLGKAPYVRIERERNESTSDRLVGTLHDALADQTDESWGERERAAACLEAARVKCQEQPATECWHLLGVAARLIAQHHTESESRL